MGINLRHVLNLCLFVNKKIKEQMKMMILVFKNKIEPIKNTWEKMKRKEYLAKTPNTSSFIYKLFHLGIY